MAPNEACDYVSLRFGISRGWAVGSSRNVDERGLGAFTGPTRCCREDRTWTIASLITWSRAECPKLNAPGQRRIGSQRLPPRKPIQRGVAYPNLESRRPLTRSGQARCA